jgi:hypothetical protein
MMVIAGAVAVGGVVAFLAAHLVLLALAAVALPVGTLAAVRYLRRYTVVVHKQPPRPMRPATVVTPAIAGPRSARYAVTAGPQRARAVAGPAAARAIESRPAAPVAARLVPAGEAPAAAQIAAGGYHLHFHGVSAAEVAAILRRDGEPALPRREDAAALRAAEDRSGVSGG